MIDLAFKTSLFLTLLTTGLFLFFGSIYSFIERRNTKYLLSTFGSKGILFTGVIGTSIHEIGHLIMCLIFHHKITTFQLFNFKGYKYEETLGYVSHRYNESSLYEKAGNFFIGIGPIISGTLFLIISFKLLLPDKFALLNINNFISYMNFENIFLLLLNLFKTLFFALFNIRNLGNIKFYIFIYLMFCVSTHMSLSKKDFENSMVGIFSLFIIFFIISFISIILNLNSVLSTFISYMLYLFVFLSIGLIFSIISLFISFTFYVIKG